MSAADTPESHRVELRYVTVAAVAVVALIAAQVLGGWIRQAVSDEPSILELVERCLTERSRPFGPVEDDPIASSAGRGALWTNVDGNRVTVALGSSEDDAERVYQLYAAVAPEGVAGTRLEQNRKAVFLWESEPTAGQREFMQLCTLDAQQ